MSCKTAEVEPEYDPISNDFLHPRQTCTTQVSLVPPDSVPKRSQSPRKKVNSEKVHKTRPKSAPKHRQRSTRGIPLDSNEEEGCEEFSEEELRLPVDDDEGSSAISDQDYMRADDDPKHDASAANKVI